MGNFKKFEKMNEKRFELNNKKKRERDEEKILPNCISGNAPKENFKRRMIGKLENNLIQIKILKIKKIKN